MNKTRAEKRRRKIAAGVRLGATLLLLLALFLVAAAFEDKPQPSDADERARTVAASQIYDETLNLFGDKLTAEQVAQGKYEELGGDGRWNS